MIRGVHAGVHGPSEGYRYDGLYRVEDYWPEIGLDGYRVWRYRLVRIGEAPIVAGRVQEQSELFRPERTSSMVSRIVRDTAITREVKKLHGFCCQVCGETVLTPAGPYAEGAHIRPLGRPHDGPDILANVLCLCPNHHAAFDRWAFTLADDLTLIGLDGALRIHPRHSVGIEYVQ